ncbi:MAG: DnaJ domain-containing protein [Alphaproteobacteria bacterium]|nr:DnaJ domain-containing protein [Alphaproteobacteria bacterium]
MFLIYLIIGTILAFALWQIVKGLIDAKPANVVKGAKIGGAVLGGIAGLWLLLTGRLWSALAIGSMYGPQLARWFTSWKIGRNDGAPDPDASSGVESTWLRMELDHATGALDGLVLQGSYRGKRLSELEPNSLADLLGTLRIEDGEGAQLLEAYLDRVHPEWRGGQEASSAAPAGEGPMSRAEAARLLGVAETASVEEIKAAHRRLMLKVHPDHGGSDYLAAKINQAKTTLLGA